MAIKNVALVGANGNLGGPILEALLASEVFNVTVVKRASSLSSSIPTATTSEPGTTSSSSSSSSSRLRTVTVDDDMSFEGLRGALEGQDACVACFPLRDPEQHLRLADAAAAAGVRRFIPADYGSCDSSTRQATELVPLFLHKQRVRDRLREHAARDPAFTWTSLVAGHFFDWGLREDFLHFDLRARTADILGDGSYRSSTSTLAQVARAVVKVLRDEVGANRMLFLQSFCVTQLEVLASLERATGGAKWTVNWVDTDQFIRENKVRADAGDAAAVSNLVFALGAIDGDWEKKDGFAMDLLDLQEENMDEIVQKVVAEFS